ncbi:hypothetical protein [Deinococcus apachensis]|uniref:hypothetical protein n=1 Tax=Deinococcus apachensis TaxID=309886 RepID=UPI00037A6D2C|nr:hypothetical protein [Deinococcus apachensis]
MTSPPLGQQLSAVISASIPDLQERLESDPQVHLELVRLTAQANQETNALLSSAVSAARTAGQSWEAIGQVLHMTRQAAQQRFGKGSGEASTPMGETRRLTPLTAFDEMEVLNRAGRYGWHSIGFGMLYHTVQKTEQQWEHRRVVAFDPSLQALEAAGWQRVGTSWFPWAYYARPTGETALPMPTQEFDLLSGL